MPTAVNLDEAELELRYTIFVQRWDEGEDLQIGRAGDAVVLSGTASSAEQARQMEATLASLPGVRLAISTPCSVPGGAPGGQAPSVSKALASSADPLLKRAFDSAFVSPAARRDFVDGCLLASDSALAHAWALKRLVERYTESDLRALKPDSEN